MSAAVPHWSHLRESTSVAGMPRNVRSDSESLHRQAIPRCEPIPSKYPTSSMRK